MTARWSSAARRRRCRHRTDRSSGTNPYRTAKLSEEQMQDLLAFALGEGNLGVARAQYDNPMVDRCRYEHLHGRCRRAEEDSLRLRPRHGDRWRPGPGRRDVPSTRWRPVLVTSTRAARSRPTSTNPTAYRGILMDGQGMVRPRCPGLAVGRHHGRPTSAGPADPNAFQLATRTLTPAEVGRARGGGLAGRAPGHGHDWPGRRQDCIRSRSGRCSRTRPS